MKKITVLMICCLFFQMSQSLISAPPQETHEEWLLKRLAEVRTVNPGMTRVDLLKVFAEDGGLNTIPASRYTLKSCPYIKVDVQFNTTYGIKYRERPDSELRITKISAPYLGYLIVD
jgi:hypothetical protein